MSYNIV